MVLACRWRCKPASVSAGKREPGFRLKQILEQPHTANQLPAARGGASAAQAPPAPVPAPVQALAPPPASPAVSRNASVFCNRKRTIPNILSRTRKPKNAHGESAGWPRPCRLGRGPGCSQSERAGQTAGVLWSGSALQLPAEQVKAQAKLGLVSKLLSDLHVCVSSRASIAVTRATAAGPAGASLRYGPVLCCVSSMAACLDLSTSCV